MRPTKLIIPLAIAGAVLAGCGDDATPSAQQSESATPPSNPPISTALPTTTTTKAPAKSSKPAAGNPTSNFDKTSAPTVAPTPKAQAGAVPKSQIDGTALPKNYPKQAVAKGTSLTVLAMESSACMHASARVVKQTNAQVSVQITTKNAGGGKICAQIVRYPKLTVKLAKPLAKRKLVLTAKGAK